MLFIVLFINIFDFYISIMTDQSAHNIARHETSDTTSSGVNLSQKIQDFFLRPDPNLDITKSPCWNNTVILMVFRIIAALYFMACLFLRLSRQPESVLDMFLYLTLNGVFFNWLYFLLVVQFYIFKTKLEMKKWQYAIQIIFQIAICYEFTITLLYWGLLYGGDQDGLDLYYNMNQHALPFIFLFIDFVFSSYRFVMPHLIIIEVCGIIYALVFNMIWSLQIEAVYFVLTWQDAVSVGMFFGALFLLAVMFGIGKITHHCIKQKCFEKNKEQKPTTSQEIIA